MKTPEFYLDEVAKEKGYEDFKYSIYKSWLIYDSTIVELIVKEAMKRYAEDACKEQRQICADNARTGLTPTSIIVDKNTILQSPTPKFEN